MGFRRSAAPALIACVAILAASGPGRADTPVCTSTELAHVFALAPEAMFMRLPSAADTPLCAAMLVKAGPAELHRRLFDPKTYAHAIPSFVRVEVTGRWRNPDSGADELRVDWELEVPLSNLSGRLWLKSFPDAVQIRLTEGAFAPGEFLWRFHPAGDHRSILSLQGTARPGNASWATRKLAARHPLAEPAMTIAAALVLLRAVALDIAPNQGRGVRFPEIAPEAPPLWRLDGETARRIAGSMDPFGLVQVAPGGRLAFVQIAAAVPRSKDVVDARLHEPKRWHALPGWSQISAGPQTPVSGKPDLFRQLWAIKSSIPFVDFATTWDVTHARTLRAVSTSGDGAGAVWGWDTFPQQDANGSLAVFSLYPRLECAGIVPRKFIAKEPLLEHGLSLALAFVDALSLLRNVVAEP